ncbi:unnamed protein product [Rotaria sp. Silwood1]|nr:unnamed protein product [Rotaria sp. Silwood1]
MVLFSVLALISVRATVRRTISPTIIKTNENFKKFIHPSLLSTYKQCVECSVTQFKSGLNNRPGLGLLQSFLHTQSESNDQQTNNSSINQTFFSL